MESPTSSFHGRGYKEEGGKEALIADGSITKSDPGPFLGNGSMDVCERCAGMNYDELAELEGYVPEHGQLIMELGSTLELASSPCPVCRLFASVSPAKSQAKRNDPVHLRAFKAYDHFTGTDSTARNVRSTTLLGVVLKWDYSFDIGGLTDTRRIPPMLLTLRTTGALHINTANHDESLNALSVRCIQPTHFDLDIARYWQGYCRRNHTSTCGQMERTRPTSLRLIDCETRKIVQPSSWVAYAALSYVWGDPSLRETPQETVNWVADDDLPSLPRTIEDSIIVARRLDFRYLWVDRYCINQTDIGDKHHQIQQMDAIYRSAKLTIIAAAEDGPDYGLPGVSGIARTVQQNFHVGRHCIVQTLPHPSSLLSESKWATRGWTYQEGLLSRRRLVFTTHQVLYECDGMHCHETIDFPLDDMHLKNKQRFRAEVPSGSFGAKRPGRYPLMFMQHAAEYYERHISYPDDALNAIHGIFVSFEEQLEKRKVYNVCGIPVFPRRVQGPAVKTALHSFLTNLFWYHTEPGERRVQFPSWSWVGWYKGSISTKSFVSQHEHSSELLPDITVWIEESPHLLCSFIDASLPSAKSLRHDAYFLHIETWTMTCTIDHLTSPELPAQQSPGLYAKYSIDGMTSVYSEFHCSVSVANIHGSASAMHPKQYLGLILPFASSDFFTYGTSSWASVLVVEQKGEYYERVGIFHIGNYWTDSLTGMGFHVGSERRKTEVVKLRSQWMSEAPRMKRKIRLG